MATRKCAEKTFNLPWKNLGVTGAEAFFSFQKGGLVCRLERREGFVGVAGESLRPHARGKNDNGSSGRVRGKGDGGARSETTSSTSTRHNRSCLLQFRGNLLRMGKWKAEEGVRERRR